MHRRLSSRLTRVVAITGFGAVALALPRWLLGLRAAGRILDPNQAPAAQVAIVFGAGLRRDGTPTLVLADRVAVAAKLYQQGKVRSILLTGSTRDGRSEPRAMRALALRLGVPESAISIDEGGTRTYESCARAKRVFGVQHALLVTQRFHLPRALALCDSLGIEAWGVSADLHAYSASLQLLWELREVPASLVAFWETHTGRPDVNRAIAGPGVEGSPHDA